MVCGIVVATSNNVSTTGSVARFIAASLDLPLPRVPERRRCMRRLEILEVRVDDVLIALEPQDEYRQLAREDLLDLRVIDLAPVLVVLHERIIFCSVERVVAERIDVPALRRREVALEEDRFVWIDAVRPLFDRDVELLVLLDAAGRFRFV